MSRWTWLLVLLGSIVLFVSIGARRDTRIAEPTQPETTSEPDLYMADATIAQYDDDGRLRYRLASDEVRHFEADSVTRLSSPTLTLNRAPQSAWLATAKQGTVEYQDSADGRREEIVHLSDDVRLEQQDATDRIELRCDSLRLYPARRFAETDQPVMITSNSGRTSAAGLSGDLKSGLLKLSSSATQRVHTVVLPGQFKRAPVHTPG